MYVFMCIIYTVYVCVYEYIYSYKLTKYLYLHSVFHEGHFAIHS